MSKAVLLAGFWLAISIASVALARKHGPEEMHPMRAEAQVASIPTNAAFARSTHYPGHAVGRQPG